MLTNLTNHLTINARTVDRLMGAIEAILLAVIGRVASWVASIPCAVLTARASAQFFDLSWPWAVAVAVALELVGQTTSNLWLTAKEWNQNKPKSAPVANERLALRLMVSYFVADFLIIAALEVPRTLATGALEGLTALLFPIMAVVGVLALNERVAQFKREVEVESDKLERKEKRKAGRQAGRQAGRRLDVARVSSLTPNASNTSNFDDLQAARLSKRQERVNALLTFYLDSPDAGPTAAGRAIGVSRQTVYTYLDELETAGRLRRNGKGVEVMQ